MKRALGLAVLALALVTAIMVVRALSLESRQVEVSPAETLDVDEQAAAMRFDGYTLTVITDDGREETFSRVTKMENQGVRRR